jgi:hypothetical protein
VATFSICAASNPFKKWCVACWWLSCGYAPPYLLAFRRERMAKKKTKQARTVDYINLERVVDTFTEIYARSRARAPISLSRRSRGLANGSAPSAIDFLVDVQIAVRRKLKDAESRRAFWRYCFSAPTKGEDGVSRKIGTECWAVRFATETQNLIPSQYFRAVVREGSKDTSPLCGDIPRLGDIRKKYERLRKNFEVMRAQRDIQAAEAADEAHREESDSQFLEEELQREAIENDAVEFGTHQNPDEVIALDGVAETDYTEQDAFARQEAGIL